MKMQDIREIARYRGLKPGRVNKLNLIQAIQIQENNIPCFATSYEYDCDQYSCLWREDCFSAVKKAEKANNKLVQSLKN